MQGFLLKVLVLLFLGLAVGLFASRNTRIQVRMEEPATKPLVTPAVKSPPTAPPATGSVPATGPTVTPPVQPVAAAPVETSPAPVVKPPAPVSAAEGYFISLPDAKKMFDAGNVIFIDAREFDEYKKGHIRGSMHVNKRYFDGAAPKKVRDFLPGTEVIVYCHGEACSDSEAVITRLQALRLGIGPYHILKDGFPGWKDAGYPIDIGDEIGFQ